MGKGNKYIGGIDYMNYTAPPVNQSAVIAPPPPPVTQQSPTGFYNPSNSGISSSLGDYRIKYNPFDINFPANPNQGFDYYGRYGEDK
jgi:hypothetical protein